MGSIVIGLHQIPPPSQRCGQKTTLDGKHFIAHSTFVKDMEKIMHFIH